MDENSIMKIVGTKVVGTRMYNTEKRFVVPDGITEIGDGAFNDCTYHLEEVILPQSVERIGNSAFFYCKALKKIDIPSGVKTMGEWCFGGSTIKEIVIPKGVTRIEKYAFCGSTLKKAVLPHGIKFIGQSAFQDTMLKTVFIPKTVEIVERDAFKNCKGLTIYCESAPTDGFVCATEMQVEREYITTAEDDAFNFHRSGGSFTSHAVETKKQVEVSWNPDKYPVFTGVSPEQYLKIISE